MVITMDIIEHKHSCCGRGLVKGSQEAKDWAKKMAEARKAKKVITKQNEPKVKIEMMGEPQLILPEYFAVPRKNGYKLVNPITQERNLSRRKGELSVRILRKPVENAILLEGKNDLIPLSLFSKKDRELIKSHFDKIEQNKDKSMEQKPIIPFPKPKERGRPERLPKNIEVNKERNEGKNKKGRPSKYKSQEEAKKAKAEQDKARYAKKKADKNKPSGGSVMTDIANIVNVGKRKYDNTIKRISSVAKEVFYGATELPRPVQDILKKYGNEEIASITLMRTPVPKVLTGALSLFSAGKFGERMKQNEFDTLFHLFLEAKLISGKRIQVEKNERINMIVNPPSRPNTEIEHINETLPSGFNLNTMMANTERVMGKNNFLGYSARDNNCQDFLASVLRANNLGDEKDIAFIKQDTKSLFQDLPYLRKFSNTLTDIGAKVNTIVSGGGVKEVQKIRKQIKDINDRIKEIQQIREGHFDKGNYNVDREPIKSLNDEETRLENILEDLEEKLNVAMYGKVKYSVDYEDGERIIDGRGNLKNNLEKNISNNIIMEDRKYFNNSRLIGKDGIYRPPMSGKGRKMKGCSTCPMCGAGIGDWFKKVGNTIKSGFEDKIIQPAEKTFTPQLGREITSGLIHKALPAVISGLAGSATTALTGNPYAGFAVGQTAGKFAGKEAGDALGKATGYGLKKPNAWIALVKKVQQEKGVSYKEAMSIASQMRRKN